MRQHRNIGGTSPMGYADNTVAPLMDAIYCGEDGQKIKDSRIKLYGWLDPGMNIRVGRYISIPDIEAQLAPNNYTYSHSLLYSFDPYTHEGVVTTVKLKKIGRCKVNCRLVLTLQFLTNEIVN